MCYLIWSVMPDGGRLHLSRLCFLFPFFSLPFALLRSRVRHGAARLSWHGVGWITCVQSLITSFRIDYYSTGLGSWRVTEEATKTPSCTARRCCCGYINVWESIVMWSLSLLAARWLAFCFYWVSPWLSHLFNEHILWLGTWGHTADVTSIPASSTIEECI